MLTVSMEDLTDDEKEAEKKKKELKTNQLHHRIVLSYLKNTLDKGDLAGYAFPCLCRRVRVDSTYRRYEAWEKKMGKMHWVSRNVFVPGYEYIEVTVSNRKKVWMGKILYDTHNLSRVRATTDDTWDLDKFQNTVQRALQYPFEIQGVYFLLREEPLGGDAPPGKTKLSLEIKEKTAGRTIVYCHPVTLSEIEPSVRSPAQFLQETYAINLEALCRYSRTGKISKCKQLVEEGFVDVHAFLGANKEGWCALQWAADRGQRKTVLWLLEEQKVDPFSRSVDGWTSLHCASKNGHFEVCKIFYDRGISLHDETFSGGGGLTPVILMMENRHVGMLRYFLNEQSRFAKECYTSHGVRNKEMPPDMYLTLKPLPPEVMKEIRRAKRIKRAQLEEARDRKLREEAGLPPPEEDVPKTRQRSFSSKKGGAPSGISSKKSATASTSPSPTRQGTSASTRQEKSQASPSSSVASSKSRASPSPSPSPPRRK